MSAMGVGSFGAFSFLLMLQRKSTGSDQSTIGTFNLFLFQLGRQSKMPQKLFLVGPANNTDVLEITAI